MIRINLLPEEFRRSERTSPRVFATMLLSVIFVCCTFGWFGYVYLGELGRLEMEHMELSERLTNLNERVTYFDDLSREKTDYSERAQTIEEISGSRILWTKVLDEFIDVVNNAGDVERHRSWFRQMQVRDGRSKVGPKVTMPGWVQGGDLRRVANFHDDLWQVPFFVHVAKKSLPSGKRNEDPTKNPKLSLGFNLNWVFQRPQDWKR